jgi:hypothetical protein
MCKIKEWWLIGPAFYWFGDGWQVPGWHLHISAPVGVFRVC